MGLLFKNKDEFDSKLDKLKLDGIDKLHIVSDFDRTITRAFTKTGRVETTYSKIRNSGLVPEGFVKRGEELFEKYYPVEISSVVSLDEKKVAMTEWWEKQHSTWAEFKINKRVIIKSIDNSPPYMRVGACEFLEQTWSNNIPLLIFSAGNGDGIKHILDKFKVRFSNIRIVSNFIQFDESDIAVGFHKPLIHTFNKSEKTLPDDVKTNLRSKQNVILLGDSLGDLTMADGMSHDCVLKIGFLNDKINELQESYLAGYDVVITEDGDFSFINDTLQKLLN